MDRAFQVTDAHRADYARLGAVRLAGAIPLAWVARLRDAFEAVMAASERPDFDANDFASPTQNALNIRRGPSDVMATNMVPAHPDFVAFVRDSDMARIVADLVGSERLRFWIDAVFEKRGPAGEGATPWHHDICTWPFWGEQMPILWVPLTDVGPEDAPLVTLDGSHSGGVRYHSPFSNQNVEIRPPYRPWDELMAAALAPDAPTRAWPMPAGDCLVMHPAIVHSSRPWRQGHPGRRLAISLRWLGDDVRWDPDEFAVPIPKLDSNPLMRRGAPPPDELFPPVWPRADA